MSFDILAPHYRWLEFVLAGSKLQRCRTAFLSEELTANRVLILGEGNGRFLVECRRCLKSAQITCVDGSARMLELARQRLLDEGLAAAGTEFVHVQVQDWEPPKQTFDLIVTHFFLDCFPSEQLERLVGKLAAASSPGALWWLADFQVPANGVARWRAAAIHRLMYMFFRALAALPASRLTPPDALLRAHGFVLLKRLISEWGLLHADQWKLEG